MEAGNIDNQGTLGAREAVKLDAQNIRLGGNIASSAHQFFSDSNGNVYHWAGTLDRSRINKLNISVRRELGIPGK
ncbi:TPA: hypothetical protein ACFP4Q_002114 [Neisseria weaveri]